MLFNNSITALQSVHNTHTSYMSAVWKLLRFEIIIEFEMSLFINSFLIGFIYFNEPLFFNKPQDNVLFLDTIYEVSYLLYY